MARATAILDSVISLDDCPFCSGSAQFVHLMNEPYPFRVCCSSCKVTTEGSAFRNDEYNAERWNRRA